MKNTFEDLIEFCRRHKKIACYGAAQYGYIVKTFLEYQGIEIDCFFVSEDIDAGVIKYGIPVKSINDNKVKIDDYGIILSLSPLHYPIIKKNLANKYIKIPSIYELNDFLVDEIDIIIAVKMRAEIFNKQQIYEENETKRYNLRIKQLQSRFQFIEVNFMLANTISMMGEFLCYYYEKKQKNTNIYELYYPKELFREYSNNNLTIANEYLLKKLSFEDMEAISKENIRFWQYFYYRYPDFFVFNNRMGLAVDLFDIPKTLKGFEWNKEYITFTIQEEIVGRQELENMGIEGDYICIANRDNEYYKQRNMKSRSFGDLYRNSDILTRKKSVGYLNRLGIKSIRMGAMTTKKIDWCGLIDYANRYRTPFLDIYLAAKCKFFISDLCGIVSLPEFFSKPQIITNAALQTIRHDGMAFFSNKKDIAILKKMWDPKKRKYLTLRNMLEIELDCRYSNNITDNALQLYSEQGIIPIENTAEEIFEAVKEMNDRLDGKVFYDKLDCELQERYQNIIEEYGNGANIMLSWRLSKEFLRNNQWLLE